MAKRLVPQPPPPLEEEDDSADVGVCRNWIDVVHMGCCNNVCGSGGRFLACCGVYKIQTQ